MRRFYHFSRGLLPLCCLLPLACSGAEGDKPTDVKIEVLKPGTGPGAKPGDVLKVHYIGWVKDSGVKFDSSFDRGQPFEFTLGKKQAIAGWDIGLDGAKAGEQRRLIIPSELAYGKKGNGRQIPPDATLLFEVKLESINDEPPKEERASELTIKDMEPGTAAPRRATPLTQASELKIEDLEPGTGEGAKPGDQITVHYTGWLTNKTKFDSSLDRGQPFSLRLGAGQVIPGWDRGLVGMKKGGKRRLTIPGNLAYGERGSPPTIPPNATLIFEVEMVDIK